MLDKEEKNSWKVFKETTTHNPKHDEFFRYCDKDLGVF